jgi:hypothetical protein
MRMSLVALWVAALPALGVGQQGAAPDASPFFDSGVFELQDNYELEGTVASVDERSDRITIRREDVPSATLRVAPDTRVRVDGSAASLADIRPGSEIHATFNVSLQTPLAIELEVDSREGGGSSPHFGIDYYDGYGWYDGPGHHDGYDSYDGYYGRDDPYYGPWDGW